MRTTKLPPRDMTDFPTQLELIAASALLLLPVAVFYEKQISQRTDFSDNAIQVASKCEQSGTKRDNSITSDSISSDNSWMTSEATSGAVQARRMKLMSAFTAKLKELRRRRSKLHRSVHGCLVASRKPVRIQNVSETTSEVSCISSGTSDLSSSRSRRKREKKQATTGEELKGKRTISYNICLRAEAILNFLSVGCSSEVRIRQVLGDSPDTSKALRILLKRAEIKRTGAGGRSDPYIYRISAEAQERPS